MLGDRRARARWSTRRARRHSGPISGIGNRPPIRTAWVAVTAPGETTLTGPSTRAWRRGHDRRGRVLVVDHRERRVGQQADRDDREAQQPAERAGHVRPDDRCQPHGRDRDVGRRRRPAGRSAPSRGASGRRRWSDRAGRTRPGGWPRPGGGRRRQMPDRTMTCSSDGHSAAAPSTPMAADVASSGPRRPGGPGRWAPRPRCGRPREDRSSRTRRTIFRRSRGSTRWKVAERRRRRGGSMSSPVISPTQRSFSSSVATSEPSSLPMPLTRTRLPAAHRKVTVARAVGAEPVRRRSRCGVVRPGARPPRPGGRW